VKRAFLKWVLFFGALCLPGVARAEPIFGLTTGYSIGTLTRKTTEKFSTISVIGYAGYSFWGINVSAFFQHMDLSYTVSGAAYNGLYALTGVGAGYQFAPSKSGNFSVTAQYPLTTAYSVLSESTSTVNGQNYQYSELTTLTGGTAFQIISGYNFLIEGSGAHKKGENLHGGLHLGYLKQNFTSQATRIKTNNSDLAPASTGTQDVNYSVSVISLYFVINYDI
jgi:hypothetical protein